MLSTSTPTTPPAANALERADADANMPEDSDEAALNALSSSVVEIMTVTLFPSETTTLTSSAAAPASPAATAATASLHDVSSTSTSPATMKSDKYLRRDIKNVETTSNTSGETSRT